jgi:DNA-binding PadR family transcriptional regulator
MPLPDVTHLQFFVLALLLGGERAGKEIRAKLAEEGQRKTSPAFYQMMARMEDAHLVEGWYDQKVIDSQIIKERRYRITAHGITALEQVREFYARNATRLLKGGLAHA